MGNVIQLHLGSTVELLIR